MNLLLDMNISPALCPLLSAAGHSAVHWADVGAPDAPDIEIMQWAKQNGYVVITHDLDFGAILAVTGLDKPSVMQVRRPGAMRDQKKLAALLVHFLEKYEQHLEDGALIVFNDIQSRVRILPLRTQENSQ